MTTKNSETVFELCGHSGHELLKAENGQQGPARIYTTDLNNPFNPSAFTEIQGHNFGYNSVTDRDRSMVLMAMLALYFFANFGEIPFFAVATKHGNPCCAAWGWDSIEVLKKLVTCDREAILGATVTVNFDIDNEHAEIIRRYDLKENELARLIDQLIAPKIVRSCIERFIRKDGKTILMENPNLYNLKDLNSLKGLMVRPIQGGLITQQSYLSSTFDLNDPNFYKQGELSKEDMMNFIFCLAISRTSNSNTITMVRDQKLIGNGVGQQARMRAARLAVQLADENGHGTEGAIVCSDSFFPVKDGAEYLINAKCKFVFATSTTNEKRDNEIRQLFADNNVAYWQLPDSTNRGFSWH